MRKMILMAGMILNFVIHIVRVLICWTHKFMRSMFLLELCIDPLVATLNTESINITLEKTKTGKILI